MALDYMYIIWVSHRGLFGPSISWFKEGVRYNISSLVPRGLRMSATLDVFAVVSVVSKIS